MGGKNDTTVEMTRNEATPSSMPGEKPNGTITQRGFLALMVIEEKHAKGKGTVSQLCEHSVFLPHQLGTGRVESHHDTVGVQALLKDQINKKKKKKKKNSGEILPVEAFVDLEHKEVANLRSMSVTVTHFALSFWKHTLTTKLVHSIYA